MPLTWYQLVIGGAIGPLFLSAIVYVILKYVVGLQ